MARADRQHVHFVTADDGVRLAWARVGTGPPIIKAANWLTHLEYDWESPVWRHWLQFLSSAFTLVRYDERGCGLSDWESAGLTLDRWIADLERVIDAAAPPAPYTLLGISQGAAICIAYAVRHPDRVARLILYGGYTRGVLRRGNPDAVTEYQAIADLARVGWAKDNPAFRQVFTSRFLPGGTEEQMRWFNELCRRTTSPEAAAALLAARGQVDVDALLGEVTVPTLVLHARNDAVVPAAEGRRMAAGIPGARYVELDSTNHVLLEHEPAWSKFQEAVLDFMDIGQAAASPAFEALSVREREVLALVVEGLSNAEVANRLGISEKTVRNHLSNVFDKLGVWTRAQAIVFARDRGFVG